MIIIIIIVNCHNFSCYVDIKENSKLSHFKQYQVRTKAEPFRADSTVNVSFVSVDVTKTRHELTKELSSSMKQVKYILTIKKLKRKRCSG